MVNVKIYAGLMKGGWIRLEVRCKAKTRFLAAIDTFRKIPVIKFNKTYKRYESSIYYYDFIKKLVFKEGWNLYVTRKLDTYYKRFRHKRKRIVAAAKDKSFYSKYWTKDKSRQVKPFQAQAINVCLEAKKYLIGDDMGLGKTIEALGVICKAFENGCERVLIVVLNRLKYQWADEIKDFTTFKDKDISVVDSGVTIGCLTGEVEKLNLRNSICKECKFKNRCLKLRQNGQEKRKYQFKQGKIVICNYEIIDKSKHFIVKQGFKVFVLDEASKIKNRKALVTKAVLHIRRNVPNYGYFIPMSGTFIETSLEDLWGPFSFADRRILGDHYNFKNRYLLFDHFGTVVGYRREKELKKIISPHIIARPIEKVWKDRPPLTETTRVCEMTKLQREIYNEARDGVLQKLKDLEKQQKINRANILPLMNYLIQICDTTETQDKEIRQSGKLDVLKDIIENEIHPRHKIIIFSFFANKVIPVINREIKPYGKSVMIVGGLKSKVFEQRKNKFNKNKNIRFAVCSDSMAYGQNMQTATYIINMDLLWNPAKMIQRLRRVYRIGQTKPVVLINLVTTNSVEDRMLEVLGERKDLFNKFLRKKVKKPSVDQLMAILRN